MKIILPAIILFLCTSVFGQGINFEEGTLNDVLAKAKKENRLVFIDCYTTWCGPCKWLAANVFTNKAVGEYYNSNFVNFKLDMEKGEGKDFRSKYQVAAYPTLMFIDADGNIQHRGVGGMDTTAFLKLGAASKDTATNFGSYLRKYKAGNREPSFLASFAQVSYQAYYPFDIEEYFRTQTDEQMTSETNFNLIDMYNPAVNSRAFKLLITQRPLYYKTAGRYKVDYKIKYILLKQVYLNEKNINLENLQSFLMPLITPFGISDSSIVSLKTEMDYHQNRSRNWTRYNEILNTLVTKFGVNSISENEWVQICENIIMNSGSFQESDKLIKGYIVNGENSDILKFKYYLIQAWLASKDGKDYKDMLAQAKESALKANINEGQFDKTRKMYFPE